MHSHTIFFACALAPCLSACSSLSGYVHSYSVDYGTAMAQFQNEQLITNILRARDFVPLHFSELGQVNGSLQEQIQLGATIPFGKYAASGKTSDQLTPQVQFASTPTFTTSPLDTQAFTVGLMQPIDATYLVERWRNADPQTKQLLLFLFVDSIENADTAAVPPALAGPATIRNRPGDPAFTSYVSKLSSEADFRLISVLTPIGLPLSLDYEGKAGYKLTELIPLADEVTTHLKRVSKTQFQLYHMWTNQLALCYGPVEQPAAEVYPPSTTPPAAAKPSTGKERSAADTEGVVPGKPFVGLPEQAPNSFSLYFNALMSKGGQSGGQGGGNKPPSGSGGSRGGGAGSAPPQIASPIMPLVGFVPSSRCFAPLYIDRPNDSSGIREFQVNLRSVRGAIEYLGAILRSSAPLKTSNGATLFSLAPIDPNRSPKGQPKLLARYENKSYGVVDDNTGRTIEILSELVDSLKLSSDIATTKQVQIIP
jgi:hypothetical protein